MQAHTQSFMYVGLMYMYIGLSTISPSASMWLISQRKPRNQ